MNNVDLKQQLSTKDSFAGSSLSKLPPVVLLHHVYIYGCLEKIIYKVFMMGYVIYIHVLFTKYPKFDCGGYIVVGLICVLRFSSEF